MATIKKAAEKKTVKKAVVKKITTGKKPTTKKVASKKTAIKKSDKKTTKKKEIKKENVDILRIRIRAYEHKLLDTSVKQIIDIAFRYEADVRGPVPLPNEIKKYTVNRASFVFKNAREQFEVRVHKRLIDIINPSQKIVEALTNMNLPSGIEIDVKMM